VVGKFGVHIKIGLGGGGVKRCGGAVKTEVTVSRRWCKPGTWVTANSRYMSDSGVDSSVTGSRHMGDEALVAETVDVRDMGDTEAARSADALENNVSHG
jgi:hypothetical protein